MLRSNDSIRLQLLRFPLIVGVVFIHGFTTTVGDTGASSATDGHLNGFVQIFISQGLARCAVPIFFLISGYLFFSGAQWTMEGYRKKIRSRINTLLVPFLFWNILVFFLFAITQSLLNTGPSFPGKTAFTSDYTLFDFISAIFGVNRFPASYQFWFIRDLMILALLTPLIRILLTHIPALLLAVLLALWMLNPGGKGSAPALFFSLGAYASITQRSLFSMDTSVKWIWPIYLVLVTLNSACPDAQIRPYLHKIGILIGIPVFLYLTKPISKTTGLKSTLITLSSTSFFVFATHEPLLTIIRKILYKAIPLQHDEKILAVYFLSVAVTVVCCLGLFFLLNRVAPRLVRIIAGGR